MLNLSIPTIEALPGFDRIEVISVDGGTMRFRALGTTPAFGAAATDAFIAKGLHAKLEGHDGHIVPMKVEHVAGSACCTITSNTLSR